MSVELQFQFIGGPRGVVVLDYDHFKHASNGKWSTMCPLIGLSNEGVAQPTPGRSAGSGGTFDIVGGVLSMYEKDHKGKAALTAELRYYPKLGGISGQELKSRNFEGPFRIYRARINAESNSGTWHIVGEGDNCMNYASNTNWTVPTPGPEPTYSP